jgi:hypothetical protein
MAITTKGVRISSREQAPLVENAGVDARGGRRPDVSS